jgi:hypothetical protein
MKKYQWKSVWYCPDTDELTLWRSGRGRKKFEADHIKSGQVVQMIYVGEL